MRKWFRRLHGAQLLMLIAPFYVVGYVLVVPVANGTFFDTASSYRTFALSEGRDSVSRVTFLHAADVQDSLGIRWAGIGIAICLLTLPMIWWWLSARRRKDLPGL